MSKIIIDKLSISFDNYCSISELFNKTNSKYINSNIKETIFLRIEKNFNRINRRKYDKKNIKKY